MSFIIVCLNYGKVTLVELIFIEFNIDCPLLKVMKCIAFLPVMNSEFTLTPEFIFE